MISKVRTYKFSGELRDVRQVSLSNAWDRILRLRKSGLIELVGSGCNWMRYKVVGCDRYIQMSNSVRFVNINKDDERLVYNICIEFYEYDKGTDSPPTIK